jgi:hypothetical protein
LAGAGFRRFCTAATPQRRGIIALGESHRFGENGHWNAATIIIVPPPTGSQLLGGRGLAR